MTGNALQNRSAQTMGGPILSTRYLLKIGAMDFGCCFFYHR